MKKNETAQSLARLHSDFDADVVEIIRIVAPSEDDPDEPIKLLEVNASTVAAGIMPVYFGPSPRVPFASVTVEVTPDEFGRIQSRQLALPDGWSLGETLFARNGAKQSA